MARPYKKKNAKQPIISSVQDNKKVNTQEELIVDLPETVVFNPLEIKLVYPQDKATDKAQDNVKVKTNIQERGKILVDCLMLEPGKWLHSPELTFLVWR